MPYPLRTPDHEAAVHYVYGYALQFVGRMGDAERELKTALMIPGISRAYQHLIHYELGGAHSIQGRYKEAVEETQTAIDLYPENPMPWNFLAGNLMNLRVGEDWMARAARATKRFEELCNDRNERKVARTLANDFRLVGCRGGYLGWGIR